jgi:hypothetical protein
MQKSTYAKTTKQQYNADSSIVKNNRGQQNTAKTDSTNSKVFKNK